MNSVGQPLLTPPSRMSARPLVIGLVNNMSDSALHSTERHFVSLLTEAARQRTISVKLFTCPQIKRASPPRGCMGDLYHDVADCQESGLDALIVTGMEPKAVSLIDEPTWNSLTGLVDLAEAQGIPTVWSCLSAHVAVLHLDGISRYRLPQKLSGIYPCETVEDHALSCGLPQRWRSPHSRYHGLPEEALRDSGYTILTRSNEAGVDIFVKDKKAPFVFLQGHIEYTGRTLMREYSRDIHRYLNAERNDYPEVPANYLDEATTHRLSELRDGAVSGRPDAAMLDEISKALHRPTYPTTWRVAAIRFYANWMELVSRSDCCQPLWDRPMPTQVSLS